MLDSPIALFDSGVGGLTVLKELHNTLPNESTVYFGDTARVPYGNKSPKVIQEYSLEIAQILMKFSPKLLIVACNTASAHAIELLQSTLPIPVIGVIKPAVEEAVEATKSKRVGVIATKGTINSLAYQNKLKAISGKIEVFAKPCPLFVPFVEEGRVNHPMTDELIKEYLSPLLENKIDTLILGCTHFPLLLEPIKRFVGNDIKLIHSGIATAKEAKKIIQKTRSSSPAHHYLTSDDPDSFKELGSLFLSSPISEVTCYHNHHSPYLGSSLDETYRANQNRAKCLAQVSP